MAWRLYIWPTYQLKYDGRTIHLSRSEGAILSRLASGRSVPMRDVIDSLYGHREDGGPDDPENTIKVMACKLRKKLVGSPIQIDRMRFGEMRLLTKLSDTLDGIADSVLDDRS